LQSDQEIAILEQCLQNLKMANEIINENQPIDLMAEYLKQSYTLLNELLGKNDHSDFIDNLFKHFCIGK